MEVRKPYYASLLQRVCLHHYKLPHCACPTPELLVRIVFNVLVLWA